MLKIYSTRVCFLKLPIDDVPQLLEKAKSWISGLPLSDLLAIGKQERIIETDGKSRYQRRSQIEGAAVQALNCPVAVKHEGTHRQTGLRAEGAHSGAI